MFLIVHEGESGINMNQVTSFDVDAERGEIEVYLADGRSYTLEGKDADRFLDRVTP